MFFHNYLPTVREFYKLFITEWKSFSFGRQSRREVFRMEFFCWVLRFPRILFERLGCYGKYHFAPLVRPLLFAYFSKFKFYKVVKEGWNEFHKDSQCTTYPAIIFYNEFTLIKSSSLYYVLPYTAIKLYGRDGIQALCSFLRTREYAIHSSPVLHKSSTDSLAGSVETSKVLPIP